MRYIQAAVFALGLAVLPAMSALASHCPTDVKKIDQALSADHGLSDEQLAQVEELRDEGEQLHNAGDHDASLEKLHEALEILGMPHE
jgi:hypothetical protein